MKRFKLFMLSIIITIYMYPANSYAQLAAPTLSAGLAAVTGSKGDIDVALLTELISKKQGELRNELLQRKVINDMEAGSFGMTNYVYSSLYALLSLKDKKAIEKELLTHISILSLQVGLAESILHLSYADGSPSVALDSSIVVYMTKRFDISIAQAMVCRDTFSKLMRADRFMKFTQIDRLIDAAVITTMPNAKLSQLSQEGHNPNFSNILFDCVFEMCRRNEHLEELGFVKIHPNLKTTYLTSSNYLQNTDLAYDLDNLITSSVDVLVEYHPLFFEFLNDKGLTIDSMVIAFNEAEPMTNDQLDEKMKTAESWIKDVSNGLDTLLRSRSVSHDQAASYAQGLSAIQSGLHEYHLRTQNSNDLINANDYIFLQNYILPFVDQMVVLGILDNSHTSVLKSIKTELFGRLIIQVKKKIDNADHLTRFGQIPINMYAHLIKTISSLSRLDDVRSYEHVFNSIGQLGVNSLKSTDSKYIRDLIYFVETFTTINLADNHISIEVEKLLLEFIKIYENNVNANTQAYFGMGLNQTIAIEDVKDEYALRGPDSSKLKSLGYASEKIGLKYKFLNNKKRQFKEHIAGDRLHMNATPIVSDCYVYGYGSGLLYNVANLTTEGSSFDESMVGLGIGVAFFNSIDIAFWRTSPLSGNLSFGKNLSRGFYGISFDVKLTEYLSAIGEKRRMAKLQK